MSKIRIDIKGLDETLRFYRHGGKPLKFEGTAGSDLVYALRRHEEAASDVNVMLRRDLAKIRGGVNPVTGKELKWGRRRRAQAMRGIRANLSQLSTSTPEGGVGHKYLTRVIEAHAKMYFEAAEHILPAAINAMIRREGLSLSDAYAAAAEVFLTKVLQHIAERGSANAPFWHGDLRASVVSYLGNTPLGGAAVDAKTMLQTPPNLTKIKKGVLLLRSMLAAA